MNFPVIILSPLDIWDLMPEKGDIVNLLTHDETILQFSLLERLKLAIDKEVKRCLNKTQERGETIQKQVLEEEESQEKESREKEDSHHGTPTTEKPQKPPTPDVMSSIIAEQYRDVWLYNVEINSWMEYGTNGVWTKKNNLYITSVVHNILKEQSFTGYGESYLKNVVGVLRLDLIATT